MNDICDIYKQNVLIAKFMDEYREGDFFRIGLEEDDYEIHELEYHKNWRWIMPVIEKISKLEDEADIRMWNSIIETLEITKALYNGDNIKVHEGVGEFLNWKDLRNYAEDKTKEK
jgi:hypothetical protein